MIKPDNIDRSRRTTLKVVAGVTAASLLGSLPAIAGISTTAGQTQNAARSISATIISRADASRNYLLLQNKTKQDIAVSRFSNQLIQFDNTLLNMADAYVEPVIINSNDRVMVRLLIDNTIHSESVSAQSINLNSHLKYLVQGTRLIELPVTVLDGVATINHEARTQIRYT